MPSSHQYQPYYCEENAWYLARSLSAASASGEGHVLLVSNPTKSCALWYQRAAPSPETAIVWDYHVIVLWPSQEESEGKEGAQAPEPWAIWDLDTLLGMPCPARQYLQHTFSGWRMWPQRFQPLFRVLPASIYLATLSTDRSHMQREDGTYLQPPPAWSPPFDPAQGSNLMRLADVQDTSMPGQIMDLAQLEAFVQQTQREP